MEGASVHPNLDIRNPIAGSIKPFSLMEEEKHLRNINILEKIKLEIKRHSKQRIECDTYNDIPEALEDLDIIEFATVTRAIKDVSKRVSDEYWAWFRGSEDHTLRETVMSWISAAIEDVTALAKETDTRVEVG